MNFSNSYARLDETFYEKIRPTPVQDPQLFLWNSSMAEQLMIPEELEHDSTALAQFFSGNEIIPGSEPIATVYAGHQFGSFVPQLGDGRAHLLGEVLDQFGQRWIFNSKVPDAPCFPEGAMVVVPSVQLFESSS